MPILYTAKITREDAGAADATAIAGYYGLTKRGVTAGSSITLERTYSAI